MSHLAIRGGPAVRDAALRPWPAWPVFDEREERQLLEVLRSGHWAYNGPKETAFCREFAEFVGTRYAVCAANGTVTLQLALEACGIGLGDEVIVPGLTWQATAAAVLDVNALPILTDVCEETWCLDPAAVEAALTPRTRAIIPVHLYGSFVDMDEIARIARSRGLRVIEDCAHKHGAVWDGKRAGSLGDIGSFSFQLSKLMTAGEGGALTTDDPELHARLDALRNCGRRPEPEVGEDAGSGAYGHEGRFIQSGNYRLTDLQAAILLESLARLPEQTARRDTNALHLNHRLEELPGVTPMRRDPREEVEAYFNFAFRYRREEFRDLPVETFRAALGAELGLSVEACYEPLTDCELYTPHTKPARHRLSPEYWERIDPARFDLPRCRRAFEEESVCFHFAPLMGSTEDMDEIAGAIEKVYRGADELRS